jgi:hypothetical protein
MASGRRRSIAIEMRVGASAVPRSSSVKLVCAYRQDALSFTNDDGGPDAQCKDTRYLAAVAQHSRGHAIVPFWICHSSILVEA